MRTPLTEHWLSSIIRVQKKMQVFSHSRRDGLSWRSALRGHGDRAFTYFMENAPAAQNDRAQIRVIEPYCYGQFTEERQVRISEGHMCTGSRELLPRLWSAVWRNLGMRPDFYGLHLSPAIPHEWEEFEVNKVFRGCQLHIVVKNPGHVQSGCDRLLVNGVGCREIIFRRKY